VSEFTFAPAAKVQEKARVALDGPSGSGKTYTGLVTAFALGEKVAVVDTERGSASKYAGLNGWRFDTLKLHYFAPLDLSKALAAAGSQGYDVVLVDSLSHFWSGSGGMLEQVDEAARRGYGGNSFGGWKEARPMERAMIDALLGYPGHVIVTMRTKTEWVIEEDQRGKKVPRKLGTKPEQREGIEYEFDIVADLDIENTLVVSKSRIPDLAGAVIRKPDGEFGRTIREWLSEGEPGRLSSDYRDEALDPDTPFERLREIHGEVKARGWLGAAVFDADGNSTTLGELIVQLGHQRKPAGAPA